MPFNPDLGDTRESYDLAIALGYDWVEAVHSGEYVPISMINLEREPFTVTTDGRYVRIREVAIDSNGWTRRNRRGDRAIRRVKLVPNPLSRAAHAGTITA